jgi:hypothetical protein
VLINLKIHPQTISALHEDEHTVPRSFVALSSKLKSSLSSFFFQKKKRKKEKRAFQFKRKRAFHHFFVLNEKKDVKLFYLKVESLISAMIL